MRGLRQGRRKTHSAVHPVELLTGPADQGYGFQRTIGPLLPEGYGVYGPFVPQEQPRDCRGEHDETFQMQVTGSPLKLFLETAAACLNCLKTQSRAYSFPLCGGFHLVGLSGGGSTTKLHAAADSTIHDSFSVARNGIHRRGFHVLPGIGSGVFSKFFGGSS